MFYTDVNDEVTVGTFTFTDGSSVPVTYWAADRPSGFSTILSFSSQRNYNTYTTVNLDLNSSGLRLHEDHSIPSTTESAF